MSAALNIICLPVPAENPFELFWVSYPKRVARLAAEKAFVAALKLTTIEEIMAGVERYKKHKPDYCDWCHAATWLNQGRWLDEFEENSSPPKPSASVEAIKNQTALTRVESRIATLKGQFPLRDEKLKLEFTVLRVERERLKNALGFVC